MSSIKLGDLPPGSLVGDPTYPYRLLEYNGSSPTIIKTDYEPLRWKVICQERLNGEATTLIADAPVMYLTSAINTSESDKSNFKNSKVYRYLNTSEGLFYKALSTEFINSIIPVTITTGGVKTTDVKFFILSKTEYGGGAEGLVGENGQPIPYFQDNASRRPEGFMSTLHLENNKELIVTRGPTTTSTNPIYKMSYNGSFGHSNTTSGAVIPVVNLRSDTLVSDYKVFGAHQLFDADSKSFFQAIHVKVDGRWEEALYTGIKKNGTWL